MGSNSVFVAVTPDGKHVYVTNAGSANVAVRATTPPSVPPPGVPFLAFNAHLQIQFGSKPNLDTFGLGSGFMLSSTAPAINPVSSLAVRSSSRGASAAWTWGRGSRRRAR
ncbi:MAG: hypothetical protein WA624_24680 [Methylocella sp.]